jgi:CBS domain-containing protein
MTIDLREWMSSPLITIPKDKSVFEAAKLMDARSIGSLVVMQKDALQGIVTERDVIRKVVAKGLNPHEIVVAEIMSVAVHTVDIHTNLIDIAKIMQEKNFRRVVVTENAKVVGIITSRDLIKLVSPPDSKKVVRNK